nr:PREDICTED: protocadherin Fat 1 isoform X1 [Latimeria chalumnae]XP_014346958.1 PREDICTED: protocadherin Fat 1 isoform X1 [Latimeria chalumnae]|eukprot:XP_006001093.1 PREDICTED: protocadherin Fat 1 isoform X1 [Latimeria chalumnae]
MVRHLSMLLSLLLFQLSSCEENQRTDQHFSMQFTRHQYNATIYENSAAKTYLESQVKMGIYIRDPLREIRYKIVSGNDDNLFKAEEYTLGDFCFLRIRTKGGNTAILNREVKDHYTLTVKAVDKHTNAEARTKVKVQVLDINDLRPLFSPTSYTVSLPENTAIRTSIATVSATDADIGTNGEFYYSFKDRTDLFAIHPTSGVITLTGRLDHSEIKLYEMEILAVDRGMKLYGSSGISSMAKLAVYVEQANEHAPIITAVTLVPSDTDKDTTYAIVTVEDNDQGPNGEIASLSIVAGDPLQQFKTVRSSPGSKEYKVKAVEDVDWESQPFGYNLTLQAKDKGNPPQFSSVKVIHVTSPHIKSGPVRFEKDIYKANVSEFAPPNTPVIMVKALPSYSQTKYVFRHTTNKSKFDINPYTGLIVTVEPIKASETSYYELEVMTSDRKAFTKVVVGVIDKNDNAPEFTQVSYKASVNENVPIGTSVMTVTAIDVDEGENGYVTYSIANLIPPPFVIDYFTGVISTSEDLDYELMPRVYNLRVRASDWGSPYRREVEILVTIILNNLNDNKPLFEKINCTGEISRDLGVGEQITAVSAIDADELELVRYNIVSGNDLHLFDLNPNSGVLSLRQPLTDGPGSKVSFHSLHVLATDGENVAAPIYINITVVNNRKPEKVWCKETGVAKILAEKLLQANKLHNYGELDDDFFDTHSVNRHAPQFESSFVNLIEVKENLPVGANIIHINATDLDSGFNGKLVYVVSGGDSDSCFVVDLETGWLKVLSPLDREKTNHYTLNITVYDLGMPQKSAWRLLDVNILDANDNPPEFLQDNYFVEISEDKELGDEIIQIEATDKDLGTNGEVRYAILTDTRTFTIDSVTGIVKIIGPLDREIKPFHFLKIEARDKAIEEPELFSVIFLKISLEDINDNPPKFVPPNYHVRVREDLPMGTVIMWLEAHDPDVGQSSQVRYSLVDNGDGYFDLDKLSGALRIVQKIDFEKKQFYNLTARAKDKGKPVSLSSTCYIEVEVVDVNENLYPPLFSHFVEKGTVKENVPIGAVVMTLSAHDEDTGRDGEIRYSIRDGSGLGVFTIDEEKGIIKTAELLDREAVSYYWLTVYATDQGVVPLSSFIEVYIEIEDVNDNAPQMSEPVYYPEVMENSPKDVSVIQIEAFDPDSSSNEKLIYKITSGNPQGFFTMNSRTGLVTTTARRLDREQQAEHILEVTVTDDGRPPMSSVARVIVKVLDENDNRPHFLQKFYKIKLPEREKPEREKAARREPIYRVIATDKDEGPNAEISYSIEEGDEHGRFFIEPKTGVVSSKKFSSAGEYDILTIKAVDNGRPQKSSSTRLHVEWIPKPKPSPVPLSFDEPFYSFTVMESDPVAHMIGVITVEPLHSPLWFDIIGGNYDSRFDIDKGSGTIIVATPLDAEQKSNYNLTVEATDGTKSISIQVFIRVIDTNNHRPEFSKSKYEVSIPEDTEIETEILHIHATDKDEKNKLIYTIQGSTDPVSLKKFRLDPGTGSLYTTEKLDHETMHQHVLTVMVRDHDVPVKRNLVRVVVNVEDANDHAPWFTSSSYEGRVYESAALGSAVLQVTAVDKDKGKNAEIIYTIESGNMGKSFGIDPVLGTITIAKELDLSNRRQYELMVKATDQGTPPMSIVTTVHIFVTISDNAAPKFTKKEYAVEISESAGIGSFVGFVAAYSQSSIVYGIKAGNVDDTFDINPNSGVIITQHPLDFETVPSYLLTVQGTNMAGLSANTTVLIHLRDENDNAPIFTQAAYMGLISESAPVNSVILTDKNTPLVIRATDADKESNALLVYQIVEPSAHKYFAIDSSTGAIRTVTSLDYEHTSIFYFTVQVHDMGTPHLFAEHVANVTVHVIDVNDCSPVFATDVYEASVLVPTYKGVKVIAVNATDADSETNSEVAYFITDGNIGEKFAIDAKTGVISVQNTTQLRSRYELSVRASDGRFASTTTVKINIKESKESHLKFTQHSYSAVVQENSTEAKTIAIITAVGNQINEPLFYHILNPDRRFKISPTSGVLASTGIPFDREQQEIFDVVVEVTEELKPLQVAHVVVKVTVEDINDNAPIFVNLPYYAVVQVDAEVGHVVRQVTAIDKDIGKNGEIHYYLKEHHEYFQISPSGDILLKKTFDADTSNVEYIITIVARDGGDPALSAEIEVPVTVMNKAMPIFEKPFYSVEIPENIQLHTPVVHVQANSPEGLRVIYSITEGDPFSQFTINFNTGVINTVSPLDFEMHPAYKLNVRATDSLTGAHAEVFVDIIVADVNDNPPLFREKSYVAILSEASVVGTSVVQVTATDVDSGINQAISYNLVEDDSKSSDYFHIDSSSGLILTARMLDFEQTQQYKLLVRAVDGGMPTLSSDIIVTVNITDLNDNPPVFNQLLYKATVSELAPRGYFITCIKATDADISDVNKLEYSIVSGNDHMNFAINSKTGVIILSNLRKQSLEPFYSLNVSVSDGVFRNSAQIQITVIGTNLHNPVFSHTQYEVELSETSPVGTMVTEVKATDEDSGTYGHLSYYIVNNVAKDKFSVNDEGKIFTTEELDRENPSERVMAISLMAKDGGGKVAFCSINVILTDGNDNTPLFRSAEYKVTVGSDTPRGSSFFRVLASDADEGSNADIVYAIETDSENVIENLEIDSFTGVITTKESLIGLENKFYSFYVKARDSGVPQRESVVPVYVRILPPEVPLPKFSEPFYTFTVSEEIPIGSVIDVIRAESEQPLLYTLVKGNTPESNRDEVFVIDKNTGSLKLEKSLDHETTKWYQLSVMAQYPYENHQVMSTVDVSIQVKDANDNEPLFESNPYEAFVVENLASGTKVIQVKATDLDSGTNGRVTYSLAQSQEPDDITEFFTINGDNGWITTLKELDHEKQERYYVAVVASDRGENIQLSSTATVEVLVTDINDNPPRFTAEIYKGTVSEDDPPGGVIAILSTTDADTDEINKQVAYYITGGDPQGQFAIEHIQNEWKVYVRKPLDREEKDNYLLSITATDGTFMAKAVVEVKVLNANDNTPVCEKALYTETVPEDVLSGKLLLQVSATDTDIRSNAAITYSLHGNGAEKFILSPDSGELKSLAPLDREQQDVYNLLIRATDGGGRFCQSDIMLTVEDVNDNAPEFSADPYAVTVYENTELKTLLTRVQATDADAGLNRKVRYSLVDSALAHFSIDESSGIISLEKSLDRELQALYILTVMATDHGAPQTLSSTCKVEVSVLDINDNPPVFEHREYIATVSEDISTGTEILQVYAASRDIEANAEITYSIISGNEHGKFSIDSNTGAFFVIGSLDYEISHEYYLTVEARDGGTPSLTDVATVNINVTDINDNTPAFSRDVYTAVISEDATLGQPVITVMAEDVDGPSNNHIHYSIVNGNQGTPFTIDPTKGEIKVAKQLDREKVSGYTLTVQASDNGNPPRLNTTTVNIDVSDVNDSPPVFSQANYSIIIQENRPVGSSVLQLIVTDKDSSHNGPPFFFAIVSGDENSDFQINQQGVLTALIPFNHKVKDQYLLHVQVADSGKPQLSSSAFINIRIIEESIYPPAILPLEIFIMTPVDEYSGGVIGKIHATDQDIYDTLTYSLASTTGDLFSVSSRDGKVIAHKRLDVGQYLLNVTVTDGRFTSAADITVHIRQITQELLNHSLAVRFANLAPEEFIGDYWRNFQRALRNILGVRRSDIQIVSLQPSEPPSNLEVLLAVEKSGSSFHSPDILLRKLNTSVASIEEMIGVRIIKIINKFCAGLDCPEKFCDEKITVDKSVMSTHNTARLSFVTPRHYRTAVCLCKGGRCPLMTKVCEGNPCPEGTECVPDPKEESYSCLCQGDKPGQCSVSSVASLTYTGNSFVKYHLMENENKEEMRLSLRLRTYSHHAVVMYARGTDYSVLEIHNGRLQYKFDCGSGPGIVSVQSTQVNDGRWHSVSLAVDGNYAKLVLDKVHTAAGTAPGTLRTLNLDNYIYFGGHIRHQGTKHGRSPQVNSGFRGCMDSIVFNGQELPVISKSQSYAVLEESVEVSPGCSLAAVEGCLSSPCQNEGTCSPLSNGGYFCKCAALFVGAYCELPMSPCASNPCLYGGTCIPVKDDYICQCRGQYTGQRCQLGPYCKNNPCKNKGRCIDSLDGFACECQPGFRGERCEIDIDECFENPCRNGGLCDNTYGSYNCSCSHGFGGRQCEELKLNKYVSTPWNIGLEEVIGIIVFVAVIFLIVLIFVVFRKKVCRRKKHPEADDKHTSAATSFLHRPYFDSKMNKNIYSDIPPQVPVRPISYTPSIPSDSRNNLDRNSFEGSAIPEHPEFSTFNPDSIHGHRKAVAVCSVAPNLPPPPPSNSPSDCDSIQKPSWEFDYDTKVVDLDPCLSKKPLEDNACQPYNTRGSMSEVQSLSSFQSESCDDNESLAAHDLGNPRGYHWDTSDWMPSVQLPGIQECPQYEVVEEPVPLYTDPNAIDTDYYPGGYDIESDFPPPPEDFSVHDELPPLPPEYNDQFESIQPPRDMPTSGSLGSSTRSRQRFNLNQYLPHHHYTADLSEPQNPVSDGNNYREAYNPYTLGYNRDFEVPTVDNMSMSVYTSTASCSDVSACYEMEESEVMMSDYESGDEGHFDDVTIPPLDSQQHTEV